MGLIVSAVLYNLLVSILVVLVIYLMDLYEKEPLRLLGLCYLTGMAVGSAMFAFWSFVLPGGGDLPAPGVVGIDQDVMDELWIAFVQAGMLEEAAKLLPLLLFVWRFRAFNEPVDGIVFAGILGAGFEVYENVGYTIAYAAGPYLAETEGGAGYLRVLASTVAVRSFPGHVLFGIVGGYFLGLARFEKPGWRRAGLVLAAFGLSAAIHGTHNLLAAVDAHALWRFFGLALLVLCAALTARAVRMSPFRARFEEFRARLLVAAGEAARGERGEAVKALQAELRALVHEARFGTMEDARRLRAKVDQALFMAESGEFPTMEVAAKLGPESTDGSTSESTRVSIPQAILLGREKLEEVLRILRARRAERRRNMALTCAAMFAIGLLGISLLASIQFGWMIG